MVFSVGLLGRWECVCAANECDEAGCVDGDGRGDAGRRRRVWRGSDVGPDGGSGRCAEHGCSCRFLCLGDGCSSCAFCSAGGTIKGNVNAGGVPLPGVSVTATNTLTGKKYATTTDVDGKYEMAVPRNGRYVVKTELTGFASTTQEVMVNASSENGGLPLQTAQFKMDLASRVTPEAATPGTAVATTTAPPRTGAGPVRALRGAACRCGCPRGPRYTGACRAGDGLIRTLWMRRQTRAMPGRSCRRWLLRATMPRSRATRLRSPDSRDRSTDWPASAKTICATALETCSATA